MKKYEYSDVLRSSTDDHMSDCDETLEDIAREGFVIVDRAALKRVQTADLANRDSEAYMILEEMLRGVE